MPRLKIFSVALLGTAAFLLLWWPFSHWFFYRWYNDLLGFTFSATHDGLVKMIGTCGLMPVLSLAALAMKPKNNVPLVAAISIFSVFLSLTFLFLIARGDFPPREMINVVMTFFLGVSLPLFYRWAQR